MGDQQISPLTSQGKKEFLRFLLDDIRAMEIMIADGMIEAGKTRIGAEQEYCLVGKDLRPAMNGPEVLGATEDRHFTPELAKWNLEINLDPQEAGPGCFEQMERQLTELLGLARTAAGKFESDVVLTGILPTLRKSDLDFDNMSPNPRYRVLDNILKSLRGEDFTVNIEGVDEVSIKADSILYEACNTSFQVHLQVDPTVIADMYNWSQVVAGPVLACSVNSPLLLGKELWMETRIALFRQSVDIRHAGNYIRDKQPRVAFGYGWIDQSIVEIFRNDVARYRLLISSPVEESSTDQLKRGEIPELRAMNLHNGTLYKWNRVCYGVGRGVPHLRIENRYLPAGPTPADEIANAAFWVGLMTAMPDEYRGQWEKHCKFATVRHNFLKAAQHGLSNEFTWFGKKIAAGKLILEHLLPMAHTGLSKIGVTDDEANRFLGLIERRVSARRTGAAWIVDSMRQLRRKHSVSESQLLLTHYMAENSLGGAPVHEWDSPDPSSLYLIPGRYQRVDSVMTGEVVTVCEDDLLEYAITLMKWYDFHRLPVESNTGQICGVITKKDIERLGGQVATDTMVGDCMTANPITTTPESSVEEAEKLMLDTGIGSLPVVRDDRVIGFLTADDIREVHRKLNGR